MNEPLSIPALPLLLSIEDGYSVPLHQASLRYTCYPTGPKPSDQVIDEIEITLREYDRLEKRNPEVKRMEFLAFSIALMTDTT